MIEMLPGVIWLGNGDDCSRDALKSHATSVLVTDRDDLAYNNVLKVAVGDENGLERLVAALIRLYMKRVCVAVCLSGLATPRPLLVRLVSALGCTDAPEEAAALVALNWPNV